MKNKGGIISGIIPGSPADIAGICPGDRLISVNGHPVSDIIDYMYYTCDEKFSLGLLRGTRRFSVEITRNGPVTPGIEFEQVLFDGIHRCSQRCIFCFMDQMPRGLRKSLYFKDDDYRLSFLYGNYITLIDLKPGEWKRIIEQRLSPLYISIQAVSPDVRELLFGTRRAREILPKLSRLKDGGISFHLQVVVCPGINDGEVLKETIEKLAEFYPATRSIAIVPVGLTKYRKGLYMLKPVDKKGAREIIDMVSTYQDMFLKKHGTRLVWPADEFYIKAGTKLPGYFSYEEFPQVENGVGISTWFLSGFRRRKKYLPGSISKTKRVSLVTGIFGAKILDEVERAFSGIGKLKFRILPVENEFLGKSITVSGLITGRDIMKSLQDKLSPGETLLLPEVCLREGKIFLDGITTRDLQSSLGCHVKVVDINPGALIMAVLSGD
ncbi:MAG: DUF512 domain-containing protein [Candidatus Eremiobacteraeota bacterium]|nr:DUF512 domain-containing protein [Candidatus Eremiobacteraeota bacterium]